MLATVWSRELLHERRRLCLIVVKRLV
jgi:hypothetical protein